MRREHVAVPSVAASPPTIWSRRCRRQLRRGGVDRLGADADAAPQSRERVACSRRQKKLRHGRAVLPQLAMLKSVRLHLCVPSRQGEIGRTGCWESKPISILSIRREFTQICA